MPGAGMLHNMKPADGWLQRVSPRLEAIMDDRDKGFEDLISDFHLDGIGAPQRQNSQGGETQGEHYRDDDAGYVSYAAAGAADNYGEAPAYSDTGFDDGFMPPPPVADDDFPPPPPADEGEENGAGRYDLNIAYDPELAAMPDSAVPPAQPTPPVPTPPPAPVQYRKKKRRSGKLNGLWAAMWLICTLALAGWLAIYGINSINDLIGFNKTGREVEVTIPEGASLSDIAKILNEAGVINEPFTFELYANVKKKDGALQPGTYKLNSNLGYDQIFISLGNSNVSREVVSVTIYEGMTASEIGKLLVEKKVCSYDEFMEEVNTGSFGYEFEDMMGKDPLIYHKWEGYLFPDTYEFYVDDDAAAVVQKMVATFNNRVESKYYDRMKEMGMTLEDTITLASIIQSEAGVRTAMETISSVFHNRLNYSAVYPNLESDVTYFYYRDEIKGDPNITSAEKQDAYHTAYDTYYCLGLPVGPVCNPGLDAIEAALYPTSTNYYFFVTDDAGEFYYAETLAQHELNVEAADKVNAAMGGSGSESTSEG